VIELLSIQAKEATAPCDLLSLGEVRGVSRSLGGLKKMLRRGAWETTWRSCACWERSKDWTSWIFMGTMENIVQHTWRQKWECTFETGPYWIGHCRFHRWGKEICARVRRGATGGVQSVSTAHTRFGSVNQYELNLIAWNIGIPETSNTMSRTKPQVRVLAFV
jgi:hypothetical protein